MRRTGAALGALALISIVATARADMPRGTGAQTGDGTTPFTGLAQAPEANLYVGAATTSIPIELPPGRKGMTPKLALAYNSNGGPSPYGYGWELPLGKITRRRKDGALCGDPGEYVVVLPSATIECRLESDRCRPRREESFLDIRSQGGGSSWEVKDKSGTSFIFGGTDASRAPKPGGSAPCIGTQAWALRRVIDTNGNAIDIDYESVENVSYPKTLRYGGRRASDASLVFSHAFEVSFEWQGRPSGDELQMASAGYQSILTRRLRRIDVLHEASLVRSYRFDYTDNRRGRRSMLAAVTLHGRDGQSLKRFDGQEASTVFLYQDTVTPDDVQQAAQPARNGFGAPQYPRGHAQNPAHFPLRESTRSGTTTSTTVEMFDIDGDGFVDHVFTNNGLLGTATGRWRYLPGSPDGPLPVPRDWFVPVPSLMNAIRRVQQQDDFGACGWSDPISYTALDTLDIDGDGIADFVDASEATWVVYRGYRSPMGGGFHPDAEQWDAGQKGTSHSRVVDGETLENSALRDWNGDGRPDLVEAWPAYCPGHPQQPPWLWKVRLNTGSVTVESGFRQPYPVTGVPANFLSRTTEGGDMKAGTFDLNGDGLVDWVAAPDCIQNAAAGHWQVWLNNGRYSFRREDWPLPPSGGGETPICSPAPGEPTTADGSLLIRRRVNSTALRATMRDLLDINGDGLPDIVDGTAVRLNRGGGFAEASIDWTGWGSAIRYEHVDATGTDILMDDTIDIDGDGMVDGVKQYALVLDGAGNPPPGYPYGLYAYELRRNLGGAWKAESGSWPAGIVANPLGLRPDLLLAIENGIGGRTKLEYRPSSQWDNTGGDGLPDLPFNLWTVTRIERRDGMCSGWGCVNAASAHSLVTNIRYQGGLYDAATRELRGFRLVTTEDAEPGAPDHRFTATYFHQNEAWAGKVMQTGTYRHPGSQGNPWSHPVALEVNDWGCADPVTGATLSPCPEPLAQETWVRLESTQSFAYSLADPNSSKVSYTANLSWAPPCKGRMTGNVREVESGGTDTAPVRSTTEYACTEGVLATYVLDRPKRVRVEGPGATNPLEEKWLFYDGLGHGSVGKGNVTRVESWLSQSALAANPSCTGPGGAGRWCVATVNAYDVFGNITTVTDPAGGVTETSYDATKIHPHEVRNALGHLVGTIYDPGCGKLLSQTIVYAAGTGPPESHPRSIQEYDAYCRPWRFFDVYDPPDVPVPANGLPEREVLYRLGGIGVPSAVRVTGRTGNTTFLWTATLLDALGRPIQVKEEKVVAGTLAVYSTTTEYDDRGNAVRRFLPAQDSGSYYFYGPPAAAASRLSSVHDSIGRLVRLTNPDGTWRETDYSEPWVTRARDECASGGQCAGSTVVEHRDAFGRATLRQTWVGSQGAETLYAATRVDHDGLGRVVSTEQAEGGTWKPATRIVHTYDSLGRRVETVDPDSGDTATNGAPGVWRYGYDHIGNPIFEDDPRGGQHIQYCHDVLGRITRKFVHTAGDWNGPASRLSCEPPGTVTYHYDEPTIPYGLGRLHMVEHPTGWTEHAEYDARGRALLVGKQVGLVQAMVRYGYDAADKLESIVYPDGEEVVYGFDSSGRVTSLANTATPPAVYLQSATYDAFGRPLIFTRGNGAIDERQYWDKSKGHRLRSIRTRKGSTNHINYEYPLYRPTGQLQRIDDKKHTSLSNDLTNQASFEYDGLGRLSSVHSSLVNGTYAYDALGNMTLKDGVLLEPRTDKPHMLRKLGATNVVHDWNGNRTTSSGRTYVWNAENRLQQVQTGSGVAATFGYDHTGEMVARQESQLTLYFSGLVELRGGALAKHYMVGGQRLATRSGPAPTSLGYARTGEPLIHLARASGDRGLVFLVHPKAEAWLGVGATLLFAGLLFWPGSARRSAGITVRRGHAVLVLLTWSAATFPLPVSLLPFSFSPSVAWAGGGPAPPPPTQGPSPTPTPLPPEVLEHYHPDHLGSTHVITNENGGCKQYLRYRAYGHVRLRSSCGSGGTVVNRHEFTGYETEPNTGLQYAGARHFDPATGMFLSHDPARQFANPYAYGPWDPLNGTDPDGAWFGLIAIAIAAAIGATVAGIQALANGASFGQSLKAAAIGGVIGGVTAAGLGVAGGMIAATESATLVLAYKLALVGSSGYGLADSIRSGQAAAAAAAAVGLAFGLAGLMAGGGVSQRGNGVTGRQGSGGGLSELFEQYVELPLTQRDPTSGEFQQIVEGVDTINNPELQSEIGNDLVSGRIRVFRNVIGRAQGLTASDGTVYLSDNFFTLDAGTRGIVLSHERFHVYEGLFFGPSVRGNEALADVFASNMSRYGLRIGSPSAHFLDLYSGRTGLGRQTLANPRVL